MMTYGTPASLEALRFLATGQKRQLEADEKRVVAGRPVLDEDARRAAQLGRFRMLCVHAERQTSYYRDIFRRIGLDLATLEWDDIAKIPITPKADLRDRLADFVDEVAVPSYLSFSGGTTGGKPIALWWSAREFEL